MIRILTFGLIILVAIVVSPLWSLPLVAWQIIRFDAYELVILAICVDLYFGAGHVPIYTIGSTLVLAAIAWLRPHVAFLNQYETT